MQYSPNKRRECTDRDWKLSAFKWVIFVFELLQPFVQALVHFIFSFLPLILLPRGEKWSSRAISKLAILVTSSFTEESLFFNGLQAIVNPLIVLWLTPEYRKLLKRKEKKKRITYVRIPFAINIHYSHYRLHSQCQTTRREYSEMRQESRYPCPRNPKSLCSVAIVAKCRQLRTFYCSERSEIKDQ